MIKTYVIAAMFSVLVALPAKSASSGYKYYIPTHYHGVFYDQPTNARSAGLGLNTITLYGVENAVYNPASLGGLKQKTELYFNYATGSQIRPGSQFPFWAAAYRINDRLVVGFSRFSWFINDPFWTTIIGWDYDEPQDRKSQIMYTLSASYKPIEYLNVGISGNWLIDKHVDNAVTNRSFIISVGGIYDMPVDWIRIEPLSNQRIRFALSFVNVLLKNRIEQVYEEHLNYRDLPIHLTLGSSYHGTLPFDHSFLKNEGGFFNGMPETVDLSFHLQFRETLRGPKKTVVTGGYQDNTSISIGTEALFMDFIAFRLGYFYETRPDQGPANGGGYWMTDDKRGLTFGYGFKVPLYELSKQKIPFNADVDFVTYRLLNELGNEVTVPAYFADGNFWFSFGLKLKWARD